MLLGLCFSSGGIFAQKQKQEKIDSLKTILKNYSSPCKKPCLRDSLKVKILLDLGYYLNYIKHDTAIIYCRQALMLADNINWLRGKMNALFGLADSYGRLDYHIDVGSITCL